MGTGIANAQSVAIGQMTPAQQVLYAGAGRRAAPRRRKRAKTAARAAPRRRRKSRSVAKRARRAGRRLVKGSAAAKRRMAALRRMRKR